MIAFRQIRYSIAAAALFASSGAVAGGLPQIDPTWFPNQLLWLAICFAALYLAVSRLITPGIASILSVREQAIDGAIREAEKAKYAAESTRGDSESAAHAARAQAAEIIAKMQSEASSEATEQMHKLDRDIARRADQATAVLEDALAKASAGMDAAANNLAQAMVARLVGAPASAAVDEPKLKLAVKN